MVSQNKKTLRAELKSSRDSLSRGFRRVAARQAADRITENLSDKVNCIMLYAPINSEISTYPLYQWAIENNIKTVFPRVKEGNQSIDPVLIGSWDQLVKGPYGILQPSDEASVFPIEEIDMVIVPGIAFDKCGYRLGYGAGYYDRFLLRVPQALWVGLTYQRFVLPSLPVEPHDLNVDLVVTELVTYLIKQKNNDQVKAHQN